VLALVLAGAAALRLVGVRRGEDGIEADFVPRAWGIVHGEGLDPHPFFDHPSLLLYVLAPFESWQDAPSYPSARLVIVAIALAGVAAAWWLGERSYGVVAGGVAAVATAIAGVHVAYSRTAVADVLLATLLTFALVLLVSGRIELAALAIGLATAAKWPGALALVPLFVAGWGRWRRLGNALALTLAAFVVASPFALLHLGESLSDLWRGLSVAHGGDDGVFSALTHLWNALGPALVVAALGVAVAAVARDLADRVLLAFVATFLVVLLPLGTSPDRYVLPLVPVLGVLAGRFRSFAPVTLLLLIVPLTWTVRDTRKLTEPDARRPASTFQLPSRR
jgi:4-amino-4-deoxy-L-arabinose transferase-like glycosyltransferase